MANKISRRGYIHSLIILSIIVFSLSTFFMCSNDNSEGNHQHHQHQTFILHQIGEVVKKDNQTFIVINEEYKQGLMGIENFDEVTVIYWFDKNDTPEKRSILQVHPRGNKENPMRGVFATHSPVRPNLIAISRCKILAVNENIIEIDDIDAFHNTPVLDLKN